MSPARTEDILRDLLQRKSGRRIDLTLTRNRVGYVSFEEKSAGGAVRLRLQRAFLAAPERVLGALARWMRSMRGRCPKVLREFIDAQVETDPRPARRPAVRTAGRFHDLRKIMDGLNRDYFLGRLALRVTWGRAVRTGRRVGQRQLGSYDAGRRLVTVSPVLDQAAVPRYFVAFVVFHEMLHAVQPAGSGRDHDREFRSVERLHPDFRRATDWQRRNLSVLMRPRREPGPRRPRPGRPPRRERQGVLF